MVFSEVQREIIFKFYENHKNILDGKSRLPDRLTHVNQLYEQLANQVNAVASSARWMKTADQVRKGLKNMKKTAPENRGARLQGGDEEVEQALESLEHDLGVIAHETDPSMHNYAAVDAGAAQRRSPNKAKRGRAFQSKASRSTAKPAAKKTRMDEAYKGSVIENMNLRNEVLQLQKEAYGNFNAMILDVKSVISDFKMAIYEHRLSLRGEVLPDMP